MASSALECDICFNVFSDDNSPRIIPCSHTFCAPCIDAVIATQRKSCPTCRKRFTATSAEDLIINRSLLDVVKQVSATGGKPENLLKESMGFCLKFTKNFLESDKQILVSTDILKKMKYVWDAIEFLKEMKEGIHETNKKIEVSIKTMRGIELNNRCMMHKIDEDMKWLKNRMNLIMQKERKTQGARVFGFNSSEECLQDGEEKVMGIKELLRENERKKFAYVEEILERKRTLTKVVEEMKNIIEEEFMISAVKNIEGKHMVAPVMVEPIDQIRLSHFVEDVPRNSLVIQHESLLDTSPRRVFLDLAVEGTFLGRIVIGMKDESNLALNFLHLCAGDLGPSFANSKISKVREIGRYGEIIHMGGYKISENTIERAVLKDVDWHKEQRREIYESTHYKTGDVRGNFSVEEASQFFIVTRDDYKWFGKNCFGIVEGEGIRVLKEAIKRYSDITEVQIVDCGLMFSL